MGEPGGIGGELTVNAWRALVGRGPVFFVIDDPERLSAIGAPVFVIDRPEDAGGAFADALPVLPLGESVKSAPGVADPKTAAAVLSSIERAVDLVLNNRAAAVVTNPIQKAALAEAGFAFPGHTEFLAALTASAPMPAGRPRGPVMMLAGPELRVIPATIHIPLSAVPAALTANRLLEVCRIAADALRRDFGIDNPRLALAGLNPHAGESGVLGEEEQSIIAPAIDALNAEGINARGPLPADALFHEDARATYDAAICMYHDQALIPVKTLGFYETVNVTLGLPIVRTSPDHGTALDIAGKGAARPDSMIAAIRLAADIARRRRAVRA